MFKTFLNIPSAGATSSEGPYPVYTEKESKKFQFAIFVLCFSSSSLHLICSHTFPFDLSPLHYRLTNPSRSLSRPHLPSRICAALDDILDDPISSNIPNIPGHLKHPVDYSQSFWPPLSAVHNIIHHRTQWGALFSPNRHLHTLILS